MKNITIKQSLENSLKPAYCLLGGLVVAASISGVFLVSNRVSADNDTVVDDVSVVVPVACSMGGTVTTPHTATIMNGIYSGGTTEYANGIGSTTLSVSCNDPGGFSIYAIGFTGDNPGDNNLRGANTHLAIPTGVYASGDTDSEWSMKITKGADSGDTINHPLTVDNGFDSFHTVPSESDGYQRIAHKDAATDMSANPGASVTTTYDAYISNSQAADTYTGQVKYVMVHPFSSTDDNRPVIAFYMQDVARIKTELANATVGTELEVVDNRDNKKYTVAKMADGNIWMNQSLDFNIDSTKTYTPADTDIPSNWTPSASTKVATDTSWDSLVNAPESYDPGNLCWKGHFGWSDLEHEAIDCDTVGANKYYRVGNYYNWASAVAMNDSSGLTEDNTDANQSICPAGWTLPKGSDHAISYNRLIEEQGLTAGQTGNIHLSPVNLIYSGFWKNGSNNVSCLGYYWSSVANTSLESYGLIYNSSGTLTPQNDMGREYGLTVRCVARP